MPKNTSTIALLGFLQIILAAALGYLASELAEVVVLDKTLLFVGIVLLFVLLGIISVMLTRAENGMPLLGIGGVALPSMRSSLAIVVTTFPFAIAIGVVLQSLSLLLISRGVIDLYPLQYMIHYYEVLAGLAIIVSIIAFRALRRSYLLMFAYCLGTSVGVATTLLLFRPFEQSPFETYIGWLAFTSIVALLLRIRSLREFFSSTYRRLSQG